MTIIRFSRRTKNIRSYAIKVSQLPVPPHLIRSARRRDSAARGTGRVTLAVNLIGELGGKRGESNGTSNGERNKNLTMFFIG